MTQCKRCGANHPGPEALCARCLLEVGMAEDQGAARRPSAVRGRGRPAIPTPAELAPLFPELEVEASIGHGGMGAVYRATQKALGRRVALKVLHAELSEDPTFARRFEREARTLAGLTHPSCVAIHDFGEREGRFWLLMEYVDGASLRQLLATRRVAPREALSIVSAVCDGLQYAHDAGVVHRDIKPENILVTREGQVKILDYGLAKLVGAGGEESHLTGTFQAMGSVHYMAPEQWKHPLEVDHRADIYSLGVVFYELLTGELPVGRFPLPSQRVEVDVRLDEVVLKALEIDPERRWQHASEVKTQVQGMGGGARKSAPTPRQAGGATVERKPAINGWLAASIAAAVIFLVLMGTAALLWWLSSPSLPPMEEAMLQATLDVPPEESFEERSGFMTPLEPIPTDVEIEEESPEPLLIPEVYLPLRLGRQQAERLEKYVRGTLRFQHEYELDAIRECRLTSPGNLVVELDAFPEKLASLREKLAAAGRQVTDGALDLDRLVAVLSTEGLLARGESPVRIRIQRWKGGFRAHEEPIEGPGGPLVQYGGEALLPRYAHLWERGAGTDPLPDEETAREEGFPHTVDGTTVWLVSDLLDLGLDTDEAVELAGELVALRDRYLAAEEEASTLRMDEEDHLHVWMGPFDDGSPYRSRVLELLEQRISEEAMRLAVRHFVRPAWLFTDGERWLELSLWVEEDRLVVYHRSDLGDVRDSTPLWKGEVPLTAPYRRLWIRGRELADSKR